MLTSNVASVEDVEEVTQRNVGHGGSADDIIIRLKSDRVVASDEDHYGRSEHGGMCNVHVHGSTLSDINKTDEVVQSEEDMKEVTLNNMDMGVV